MNGTNIRGGTSWGTRLLVGLVLILVGAAAAVWSLGHYRPAARLLGITTAEPTAVVMPQPVAVSTNPGSPTLAAAQTPASESAKISQLEDRLSRVENATQRAEGFAGRADALVVAFAARRAIDRGVALGYLEPILVQRFGSQHQQAVATIITASRQPVRLNDLSDEYATLGPELRRGGPTDSWWDNLRREMTGLIEVHRAERPATNPDARYQRALQRLSSGNVDDALAETMRLPGAANATDWVSKARRYVAAHRALDEIESAALLTGTGPGR